MPLATFRYRAEIYEKPSCCKGGVFTGMCTFSVKGLLFSYKKMIPVDCKIKLDT